MMNAARLFLHHVATTAWDGTKIPSKTGADHNESALPGGKSEPSIISILQRMIDYKAGRREIGGGEKKYSLSEALENGSNERRENGEIAMINLDAVPNSVWSQLNLR